MANVLCPVCGQVVYAPDNQEFVVCDCNYVIYIPNETHDRKDEESLGDS